jgi:hypothetical protein
MTCSGKRRPAPIDIQACYAEIEDEDTYSLQSLDDARLPSLAQFQMSPIQSHVTKERWLYITAAITLFFLLGLILLEFRDSQESAILRPLSDYVLVHPSCEGHESTFDWEFGERDGKLTVNGQYPGPLIEVNVGDKINVVVRNRMAVPTSLHFYGARMDNKEDGTPFVTQKPIYPGESFTYSFVATERGTFLWGSTTDVQRLDGLAGALVVHADCKRAMRELVLVVSEVYTQPASELLEKYLGGALEQPMPTGISISGHLLAEVTPAKNIQRYRVVHAGAIPITMVSDSHDALEPGSIRSLTAKRLRWTFKTATKRPSPMHLGKSVKPDYTLNLAIERRNGHARHTVNNVSYVAANYVLLEKPLDSPAGLGTSYSSDILTLTHERTGNVSLLIVNQTPTLQPLYFHGHRTIIAGQVCRQVEVASRSSVLVHIEGHAPGIWAVESLDSWSQASGLTFLIHTT